MSTPRPGWYSLPGDPDHVFFWDGQRFPGPSQSTARYTRRLLFRNMTLSFAAAIIDLAMATLYGNPGFLTFGAILLITAFVVIPPASAHKLSSAQVTAILIVVTLLAIGASALAHALLTHAVHHPHTR